MNMFCQAEAEWEQRTTSSACWRQQKGICPNRSLCANRSDRHCRPSYLERRMENVRAGGNGLAARPAC